MKTLNKTSQNTSGMDEKTATNKQRRKRDGSKQAPRSVSFDSYGRTVLPTVKAKKGIREHGVAN